MHTWSRIGSRRVVDFNVSAVPLAWQKSKLQSSFDLTAFEGVSQLWAARNQLTWEGIELDESSPSWLARTSDFTWRENNMHAAPDTCVETCWSIPAASGTRVGSAAPSHVRNCNTAWPYWWGAQYTLRGVSPHLEPGFLTIRNTLKSKWWSRSTLERNAETWWFFPPSEQSELSEASPPKLGALFRWAFTKWNSTAAW